MIYHEYFAELISRRLDGDLTESEQNELYEHLAECSECRKLAEDMLAISEAFDESLVEAPDTLHTSIMNSVRAERAGSSRKRWIPAVAGVLAASIAVVIGLRMMPFGGSDDTRRSEPKEPLMMAAKDEGCVYTASDEGAAVYGSSADDSNDVAAAGAITTSNNSAMGIESASYDLDVDSADDEIVDEEENVTDLVASDRTMSASAAKPLSTPMPEPSEAPRKIFAASFAAKPEEQESQRESALLANGVLNGESVETESDFAEPDGEPADAPLDIAEEIPENSEYEAEQWTDPQSASTSNTLNIVSNRLSIDSSDVAAVVYNGSRISSADPRFSDVAGSMLQYLDGLELNAPSASIGVEASVECVVEYSDGHSDTIIYSSDGYLNCNGVWYEIAEQTPADLPATQE